jgi:hypothetical protein
MLKILVLICSASLDHAACDQTTAIDVVRAMKVSNPQQCGFMAQALLAQTSLAPEPGKQYVKIVCLRMPTRTASVASDARQ